MLRVRYSDTGQETVISEYSFITIATPNNVQVQLLIRFADSELNSRNYFTCLGACSKFFQELGTDPDLTGHTSFFLSDRRGDESNTMYVWFLKVAQNENLGFDFELTPTGTHFHF
jgi:hypothetical protein